MQQKNLPFQFVLYLYCRGICSLIFQEDETVIYLALTLRDSRVTNKIYMKLG